MVSKGQFVGLDWNSTGSRLGLDWNSTGTRTLDHGGSWVQIPSGTRIFFRVYISPYIEYHCCCFIFNTLTLEVGWLHLDMH